MEEIPETPIFYSVEPSYLEFPTGTGLSIHSRDKNISNRDSRSDFIGSKCDIAIYLSTIGSTTFQHTYLKATIVPRLHDLYGGFSALFVSLLFFFLDGI